MICLDDGKNDGENTGFNVPCGDCKWDRNIINTFTFGDGRSIGVRGTGVILVESGREEQVAVPEEGSKENGVNVAEGSTMG